MVLGGVNYLVYKKIAPLPIGGLATSGGRGSDI